MQGRPAPPDLLPAAVAAARVNGVIAYCGLGAAGNGVVPVDWDLVHNKNVRIEPMGEVPMRQPQAIELLRRGAIDAQRFITHTFPRDRIKEAFHLIGSRRQDVIKVIIQVK